MKRRKSDKQGLRYWLGLIVVVCILIAISIVIVSGKRQALLQKEKIRARSDLVFISKRIHSQLQSNSYDSIETYARAWAGFHSDRIAEFKVTVANGFVLIHIVQDTQPDRTHETSVTVPYSYDNHVFLELTTDLSSVDRALLHDIKTLGLIVVLSTFAMGFILYLALKHTANNSKTRLPNWG